ncbi:hypothetical protein L1987_55253 [Smallanthus sonchifolius]|uniref:Uncharacterized protein n=1 Tax=Smallanthus sonchifolius TaxID=185202 RepID=A0ACB9E9G6_9ASTR|nr:hypothetical protein L1987_55253 [Smallanthus sonchifolius]
MWKKGMMLPGKGMCMLRLEDEVLMEHHIKDNKDEVLMEQHIEGNEDEFLMRSIIEQRYQGIDFNDMMQQDEVFLAQLFDDYQVEH